MITVIQNVMRACRRSAFAAIVLLSATAGMVSAQQQQAFSCQSTATPLQVRYEGLAELVGDFVLQCTGGIPTDPGAKPQKVNIQIFLNTPTVSSRVLNVANGATEALLLIDEPAPGEQVLCAVGAPCDVFGLGSSPSSPYKNGAFNVWQGQLPGPASPNSVVFSGVPIIAPGTQGGTRTFRITNARAPANALGVPAPGIPLYVTESVATSNGSILPISSNTAQQVVGVVLKGLYVSNSPATVFQQCSSVTNAPAGSITLQKGFAAAFRIRNTATTAAAPLDDAPQDVPNTAYNTETGFYNPTLLANAGNATQGARFGIVFTNVNKGVTITVPTSLGYDPGTGKTVINGAAPAPSSLYAVLTATDANGGGTFSAASSGTITPDSSGTAMAVYEVLQSDISNPNEQLTIPFSITFVSNPVENIPAITVGLPTQVGASFAPTSNVFIASAVDPDPRFRDTSVTQPAFTIIGCGTTISVNPQALNFNYVLGGNVSPPQTVTVSSNNPASGVNFAASLGAGCDWLQLNAKAGTTPANLAASANPAGLGPGNYGCAITITAPGAVGFPGLPASPQILANLVVTQPTTGTPSVSIVSGNGMVIPALHVSPQMRVLLRDTSGNPIKNAQLNWSIQGGGAMSNQQTTTDANGQTANTFVAPAVASLTPAASFSQSTITAAYGAAQVQFTETTAALINGILEVQAFLISPTLDQLPLAGGAGQQGTIPAKIQIRAVDGPQQGQGVPGVAVSVAPDIPTNVSTIACVAGTVYTDSTGTATCNLVFGGKIGGGGFTVNVGNLSFFDLSFKVIAGPAGNINILGGDQQTGNLGTLLPIPLAAEVTDLGGSDIAGVQVVFESVVPGAVTFTNVRDTSDGTGRVSAQATLGNVGGNVQVRVRTLDSKVSALFNLTVVVARPTTIAAFPQTLNFNYVIGGNAPPAETLTISSNIPSSGIHFTAALGAGCQWLLLNGNGGTTRANLAVSVNPPGLAPGNYTCSITISAPQAANSPQTVQASVTVVRPTTISASPASLSFAYRLGSAAPAAQTVAVSSENPTNGVGFNVAADPACGWVRLSATSGTTPALVTASLNTAGLTATAYNCTLTIAAPTAINGAQTVAARLDVSDWPTLAISPQSLTFNSSGPGYQSRAQTLFIFGGSAVGFSATSTDRWLSLSFSSAAAPATLGVSVNSAGLAPGAYHGTIAIFSPASHPVSQAVPVTLNVSGGQPQELSAQPEQFTFSFVHGAQQPQTRQVTVTGAGDYHAGSDSSWLTITPGSGTLGATASTVLSMAADPTGLSPGTYTGTITVSSPQAGPLLIAFATMTISPNAQSLTLSHTGLSFRATNGASPASQKLYLQKHGPGDLSWTLTPSTTSGDNWLTVSSTNGIAGDSPSVVEVHVNPTGLTPGDYYGQISASAPDAANSPQLVGVVLTVSSATELPPLADPVGLIFIGSPGGANPAAQNVSVTNRSASALTFQSSPYFGGAQPWFTAQPAAGTIDAGQTQQINIQASMSGLAGGAVYPGELNLGFGDNSTQTINLLLAVSPAPAASPSVQYAAAGCTPTILVPLITSLAGNSVVSVGRPTAVQVHVVDDCGAIPQSNGSMQLDFNNGDPSVELVGLPSGLWTGTVTPKTAAPSSLEISVQGQIGATATRPYILPVSFGPASSQPVVLPHGLSSAASYAPQAPMAPGSLINIYGSQLADHSGQFSGFPLPDEIAGTRVRLGGKVIPLIYVSADRIIAQVPFDTGVDTAQQLVIERGAIQSIPEAQPIAAAQPGVFTVNQQGTGQGVVTIGNTANLADAAHPVKERDVIVIYCAGLGAVEPGVTSGAAALANSLSRTETPLVTIGGKLAQVQFSGLTPGFAGLYQINVVVPAGVTPGNEVPLQLTIAGQSSPVVTIAVR